MVYGKFTNKNYNSMRLPSVLVMASACALGLYQALFFAPATYKKTGPGDEANVDKDSE